MNCNLECPFAKYNGRNHDGTQDIICTRRNWFMNSSDDCIEGYTEKEMELLKRKYPSHPKERYRVFIEGETGDNVIVDMDEIPTDSNVVSLTLEDTCQRLNEQDQRIGELEKKITKIEEIIDNRLDNKIIPKWDNNNELFIEEKVGYRYALRQLKKKLIREKICFNDINIEDME